MPGPIVPVLPVLLGLAVIWTGAALVLYSGGRMRGRTPTWERLVGYTLVAVGPVLPESGIALAAATSTATGASLDVVGSLVLGAVLGSVLARCTLVLGLGALAGATVREPAPAGSPRPPFFLAGIILFAALGADGMLTRPEGGLLLAAGLLHLGRRVLATMRQSEAPATRYGVLPDPFLIMAGFGVIGGAAWFLTPGAAALANTWGVPPILPGLLVLGVGASLPELVLGIDAAAGGRPEMSASSVLANGTVGLLAPLGMAALAHPLAVPALVLRLDVPALAVLVTGLWYLDRRGVGLSRRSGGFLVFCFLAYAAARIALLV